MTLPTHSKKPLLLFFPLAQDFNYKRCLILAQHLRKYFSIQFLYIEQFASLVYQQGFDTFSNSDYSFKVSTTTKKAWFFLNTDLETQFLDQVEILETLQPALIISDGISTSSMASEFTGIPLISLLNGYESPYFAQLHTCSTQIEGHEHYKELREKFGLLHKNTIQEELEGDLNWICDLAELFPQRALPSNYIQIGPLVEFAKKLPIPIMHKPSPLKRTILIDIDSIEHFHDMGIALHHYNIENYNLVIKSIDTKITLPQKSRSIPFIDSFELFTNLDLIICNNESMLYKGLSYGIPIVYSGGSRFNKCIINALEQWRIGTSWKHILIKNDPLHYWINNKNLDALRLIQYKTETASLSLIHTLLKSITLHFPFIEKAYVTSQ